MRPKSIILLIVALGCGLVASIGINQMLAARNTAPVETGPKVTVFVAKTKIGIGDTLKPENVNLAEYPPENVPPDAITKLEDVQGRRAKAPIHPGVPIVEAQLLGKGENGEDFTGQIPAGMRAMPVRVDAQSGGAGLLKPGDRVDVVVHLRDASGGATTRTILQNLKIMAIDSEFRRDNDGQQAMVAKTISLLISPKQAEILTLATELGTIRLSMRSAQDESVAETEGASSADLTNQKAESAPATADQQALLDMLRGKKPAPEPKTTTVVEALPTAPEPPKNQFKMRIFDGAVPRDVTFEDGQPLDLASLNSSSPTSPAAPAPTTTKP